jgi:hypothetical protein
MYFENLLLEQEKYIKKLEKKTSILDKQIKK